jgi:hypothetical protein
MTVGLLLAFMQHILQMHIFVMERAQEGFVDSIILSKKY